MCTSRTSHRPEAMRRRVLCCHSHFHYFSQPSFTGQDRAEPNHSIHSPELTPPPRLPPLPMCHSIDFVVSFLSCVAIGRKTQDRSLVTRSCCFAAVCDARGAAAASPKSPVHRDEQTEYSQRLRASHGTWYTPFLQHILSGATRSGSERYCISFVRRCT